MKETLTEKQKKVYEFIVDFIEENGYSPSIREICKGVNLLSTSTVHMHLTSLEKNGYILKGNSINRSITIKNETIKTVPELGVVTAGVPITAIENIDGYFPIAKNFFEGEDHFILSVRGESMIEAGIFDQDKIIVSKTECCENGDIIVALIDDEATVKTFYKENGKIRLQPENKTMEPIIVDDIKVLGKVVGLFRKI